MLIDNFTKFVFFCLDLFLELGNQIFLKEHSILFEIYFTDFRRTLIYERDALGNAIG